MVYKYFAHCIRYVKYCNSVNDDNEEINLEIHELLDDQHENYACKTSKYL